MGPTDPTFGLRFPIDIASDGGLALDTSIGSQMRLLFTVYPGQRLDNLDYGLPAQRFEQELMVMDAQRLLIVEAVQRALTRYVPDIVLLGLDAYRVPAERRLVGR